MKSKKIISGLLALSLVFGGAVVPSGVAISVASGITAHAFSAEGSCYSFDEEKRVLTLRGEVNADELRELRYKSMVRSIIAEEGTVFPEDSSWLFGEYTSCTSIDLSNVDTSNVTNMSGMFSVGKYMCFRNLTSIDVSGFDTSSVTDMSYMFEGCEYLTSLDVSGFDTSSVTDMSYMFEGCRYLTTLDVSGFDTSNVISMRGMFSSCEYLTTLDVCGFDTSNVTDMGHMFEGCKKLSSLDVSGFDTSNVTDISVMFWCCENLNSIDVSSFDTSNVTDMARMFLRCQSLTSLDVSGFDTSKVTDMYGVFLGCQNLISLDVSGFDTSNVTDMSGLFKDCKKLTSLDLTGFDTSKVTDMRFMFEGCDNLTSLDLSSFNTSNVTDMREMFSGCVNMVSLDLSSFDTSNVTDMSEMFSGCVNMESLDLSNFDTQQLIYGPLEVSDSVVIDIVVGWRYLDRYRMFKDCKSLKTISLGEKFEKVTREDFLPNGRGWANVDSPETVVSGNGEYAVIENNGKNTYKRLSIEVENSENALTYPTNIKVEYSEQYHQIRFTWDKVENAEKYGIAVYLAGKWRIQTQNITGTIYTTPKNLTPGKTYKVAIAAKVNGQWDVNNAIKNAVTVTVK
ncbi:BspA family leucine-rich repeat surface protein [Ruminococcus sp.]|uniref:BspA family leucine-rich repeat surface protein n=1 Tax=Ruminococcus sp. TaxID=41978 RepID=UPI0025908AE6|nr:BspA family leucine-rich repeat surface protein [Ruminococcus sp.]MCR5019650.1 BspA family leucine-rich repeat surface protein [Ruminococcus sp.]